jgi:hypothetical protein
MVVQLVILTFPTMVFYFSLSSQVLWNDLRGIVIKQRHWQCFHPLPFPMAARITKYLNIYVRMGLCLIYMSSFYFWSPPFARKIGFTLFTPIKGRIDSLTVYIYKGETCTNIVRYNTCMSSYLGDRKWTKIVFLEPSVSQKNAKNQCAVLPECPSGSWQPILAP